MYKIYLFICIIFSITTQVSAKDLRTQLIGAWELVSYIEFPVDGSAPSYPLGENAKGLIIYTPDGYMSAQLMGENRPAFQSGDWFNGTSEEYIAEAKSYIAYSGRFFVDEKKQTLMHEMQVSFFPNWLGQKQQRIVALEDNLLKLSPAQPILSQGKLVMSRLVWQRAKAN